MRNALLLLAVVVFVTMAPQVTWAVTEFEPGIRLITTDELKSLLDAKKDLVLINALSPVEFRDMAIPGSVNLPFEYVEEGKVKLPDDKGKLLVFY